MENQQTNLRKQHDCNHDDDEPLTNVKRKVLPGENKQANRRRRIGAESNSAKTRCEQCGACDPCCVPAVPFLFLRLKRQGVTGLSSSPLIHPLFPFPLLYCFVFPAGHSPLLPRLTSAHYCSRIHLPPSRFTSYDPPPSPRFSRFPHLRDSLMYIQTQH